MDYTQKWSDLEGCIKKSVMTEEEEKKRKERKAHQLRIMVERADTALEGNKRLLEKRRGEMEIWESSDQNWTTTAELRHQREAPYDSVKPNGMTATSFTAATADAIESLSEEDLKAVLSLINTQAGINLTMDDIEAALTLAKISAPGTDKPAASIRKSKKNPAHKKYQAGGADSQRQERREYLAAYQHQWRARQPEGHRKAEYRKYLANETDSHREERLRRRREKRRAKKEEAERAQ
ncbi:hypothetical protein HO173_010025 [Letharia columbiana]|uniref:Uncharacterized protein n=1 Tax=Letharia columbiana TaxID=112416 RepID=A0A8H6L189_9LECA|nr:uncharacterized protein HO173_010025 [Letharia columbiana]KAF6231723.1 hypothetical protein HO173_010025 [Letharia columbiana]